MPVFFQHRINDSTRLGIWKIEETEAFFQGNVPVHRDVTHPHKRLQHLAGRFLLQFLFADFPYELVQIAETRRPFIPGDPYHFSISHCGDYAAAIVSRDSRVGIDIEIPVEKILRIRDKFLSADELKFIVGEDKESLRELTALWSAKEAVFKWYGEGKVDFSEQIQLKSVDREKEIIHSHFAKSDQDLDIHYRDMGVLMLAWVVDGRIVP